MNIVVFGAEEWGGALAKDDERSVHAREILKLLPGDTLRVGLLGKGLGTASVVQNDGGGLVLRFPSADTLEAAPEPLHLHLLVGHPRPPVMQRLLKDLNAIGLDRLSICLTELGEKSYFQSRLWAKGLWEGFLVQGAQQGGHVHLMHIQKYWSLKKALSELENSPYGSAHKLVLDVANSGETNTESGSAAIPDDGAGVKSLLEWAGTYRTGPRREVFLAIGPERGWTAAERGLFAERGFTVIGLGKRILRTETACILACGVLSLAMQE
jgi:16S rRNA (uracil1498-N3)-methyltransferase